MIRAAALALLTCIPAHAQNPDQVPPRSWHTRMDFALAQKPFRDLAHSVCGYLDATGRLRNEGLAPASYVSLVLHRMRFGPRWLERYRVAVHQWTGDRIATWFGLGAPRVLEAERLLDRTQTANLLRTGRLRENALYLFHARKGGRSHVGFVRFANGGLVTQSQFSGLGLYEGLAEGDFRRWLRASPFSTAPLQLWHVPAAGASKGDR